MSAPEMPKKKPGRKGKAAKAADNSVMLTPANDAGVSVFGGCYLPADFHRWGKMPFWTPVEAACLSLGYDPVSIAKADDQARLLQPDTLDDIRYRIELFDRAITIGIFAPQMQPTQAIALLDSREERVPDHLRQVVVKIKSYGPLVGIPIEARGLDAAIQSFVAPDEEEEAYPSTRSGMATMIATLQKLLLAAAYDAYGFESHRSHNPATKRFLRALDRIGLKVSDDAVQRHLRRAADAHWLGPFD